MRTKLALLLAALAFVAGCGGGSSRLSKAEFEQRIQADGRVVQRAVAKISGNPTSLATLAKQVAAADRAVKAAANDLEAAKPPKDAEAETKTLVTALRTVDVQLQKLEQAAKKGDAIAAQVAATAIQHSPEVAAAQKAAKSLKQKGYKIGVIGQ